MKKLLFLVFQLAGSLATMADDGVTASAAVSADLKKATVNVSLTNDINYVAFQMDIVFPDGMVLTSLDPVLTDRLKDFDANNSNRTSVGYNMVNDNTLRVVCYNMFNHSILGTSGERLFSVTLELAEDVVATDIGDWTPTLSNVLFVKAEDFSEENLTSTSSSDAWFLGDVNHDMLVNVADIICIANHILNYTMTTFDENLADVNGDETINVADIIKLANMILYGDEASVKAVMNVRVDPE